MLVLVAGHHDKTARDLAALWAPWGATILTCGDLSVAGWRHLLNDPEDSEVVIDGQTVAAREIMGVLTRLPCVPEGELRRVVPEDRAYVAVEMTSFLLSWLAGLRCPVLNRPTPTCLTGPGWRHEQWVYAGAHLRIPVEPVVWNLNCEAGLPEGKSAPADTTVTVVGRRCLGTADSMLVAYARRLARAAGVDLLAVRFIKTEAGFRLHGADPWVDISLPEVTDAILEHFCEASRC